MRIYEASISYNLIKLGDTIALNKPELVAQYLKTAFDQYPTQESFWVILLDRKNCPIGRVMISLGTLTSTVAHPREVVPGRNSDHYAATADSNGMTGNTTGNNSSVCSSN
jgi:DNA repair protein RadC